jgi:transposase
MMQGKNLDLKKMRTEAIPVIDHVANQFGLRNILQEVLGNTRHVDALEILVKNVLMTRSALYRIEEWASSFDPKLMSGGQVNDDLLARALDRLYASDRASLQTRCVLAAVKTFGVDTSTIHNDSTSVSLDGIYDDQNLKAVQLKRGHSKDHRPDLKQLVYSLSVAADEAIPVHFKVYDGNRTDDTTHQETWLTLRGLLGKSDFLYVADCKLCTEENMAAIDRNQGRFVTIVPQSRKETKVFADAVLKSDVRWQPLWRKRSRRDSESDDCFEIAVGLWQLREGYAIHWYRSTEKMRRDAENRDERINETMEKLSALSAPGRRGPKSEKTLLKAAQQIVHKYGADNWIVPTVTTEAIETYRQLTRGRSSSTVTYRKVMKKRACLTWVTDEAAIAASKATDGIFPLTTNTELPPLDVLKHYKYQPRIEKRFAFLKSVTAVAPVFLKKNQRVEALMFVYFLATLLAALVERELRRAMAAANVKVIHTLPEERPTSTPTWEQITRLFSNLARYELRDGKHMVRVFADQTNSPQKQVLLLLGISEAVFK